MGHFGHSPRGLLDPRFLRQYTGAVELSRHPLELLSEAVGELIARTDAEIAASELSKFHSQISHDLRTPLATILLNAQVIERCADSPDTCRTVSKRIMESVRRADRLVATLLDAGSLKAGAGVPIRREMTSIETIARQVIEALPESQQTRCTLQVSGVTAGLYDPDAVARILENLVGNAFKYGDARGGVGVFINGRRGQVSLRVHNFGKPIPPEEQANLFRRYKRNSDPAQARGWGLGLMIVKGIAVAHGGCVSVESSETNGTTFEVVLKS